MDKWGLGYSLRVGTLDGRTVVVEPPFTVQFNIIRNTQSSYGACQIRIFNLSPKNRDRIRFNISNYGVALPIELYAGYGGRLARIFIGDISEAFSQREGVNFVTQIECYPGASAYVNGITSETFPKGTPQREVIKSLASSLPGLSLGAVGNFQGVLNRSNSYQGNTIQILNDLTGGAVFIDENYVNALLDDEVLSGPALEISAETGLLNTPVQEQTIVRFETMFEPQLQIGARVRINSLTNKNFNGLYKCTAVTHQGIISEAVASKVTTLGEFYYSTALSEVPQGL